MSESVDPHYWRETRSAGMIGPLGQSPAAVIKQRDEAEAERDEAVEVCSELYDEWERAESGRVHALAARDEALARVSRTQKLAEKFLSRAEDAERNLRVTTEGYEIEEARATQAEAALSRIAEYAEHPSTGGEPDQVTRAAFDYLRDVASAALQSEK